MKTIYVMWVALGLLLPFSGYSQHVMGTVTDSEGEPLIGASVIWQGTETGTMTGDDGMFHLNKGDVKSKNLVISFIGYQNDTVLGEGTTIKVVLYENGKLKEAVVKRRQDGVIISDLTSVKREIITGTELRKAACCDLAGAFSTQASVKAQTTNVLTNAKELRISGLSGVYNQVLVEGFPLIQGLTYTYGISSVPGTLVKNIFISKGANSVIQGYEGITGQINVITLDPSCAEKALVNTYVNSFGEAQLNAHLVKKRGDWHTITTVHTTQAAQKFDKDDDGFMDLPQLTRYSVWTRTKYKEEDKFGWSTRIGGRLMKEERLGGQVDFNPELHTGGNEYYGQVVDIEQGDFIAKTAYRFSEDARIVLFNSITAQNQKSWYGQTSYKAEQTYFYNNLQHELIWADSQNLLKSGLSYRHFDLRENINLSANGLGELDLNKQERVWGVFAENEANFFKNRLTLLLGVRVDQHNQFGLKTTPRALLRYQSKKGPTYRLNAGKGWRTVNLFSENLRMLVSSRQFDIANDLEPEEAWNFGLSITQKFRKLMASGYVTLDLNVTDFSNQIFPLYVSAPEPKIVVRNFTERSRSNSVQLEGFVKFFDQFELKMAWNYLDVYRQEGDERTTLPFNNKHRLLTSASWAPTHGKFHFDCHLHWYGEQKMPETQLNPEGFRRPSYSRPYQILASQFTYNFTKWEWYGGCENVLDFRQERPILSWEDPFGDYFDTSSVWGPTRGREFYLGFRYFPFR